MAIDGNCFSKQTFCALNKQTVSDNDEIKFSYNGCITANEIIDNETWNELINAIIKVYNFGTRGTRNPITPFSLNPDSAVSATTDGNENSPSDKISNALRNTKHQANNDKINLDEYNEILSSIGITNTSGTQTIYGTYFKNIMDTLNSYQLNNTRCNNCNTNCNVSCQAHPQCCDSHCCTQCCTDCCTNCCTNTCSYCTACQYSVNPGCSNCQWAQSSKLIYKENIIDNTDNAVDLINNVKIVNFNYINDPDKLLKIGFIADNTDSKLATKYHDRMDFYNCIGILLKAVQELSKEIKELKESY